MSVVPHAAAAWEFFNRIGAPKLHVAPMVDQSELPFRMLCRRHGATCAYTPMMHARLTVEDPKYRAEQWTTCPQDRPLFAQFCANDPDMLVGAARLVQGGCDAIDINFGCPQRIAKRGYYGAFLMDDLPLVERLVRTLVQGIDIPVTCKIRVFPELDKTLQYARMIESAGCSVLAVHGRTRVQKDNTNTRADWDAIKAVKAALQIPVLANGNIRDGHDVLAVLEYTGCDGVLSAESLLEDPALFSPSRLLPGGKLTPLQSLSLAQEYCALAAQYPVPMRMSKGHLHKILGGWLAEYTHLRDRLNGETAVIQDAILLVDELVRLVKASGRDAPDVKPSARQMMREEKLKVRAARQAAIEEQEREAAALALLAPATPTANGGAQCVAAAQAPAPASNVASSSAHDAAGAGATAAAGVATSSAAQPSSTQAGLADPARGVSDPPATWASDRPAVVSSPAPAIDQDLAQALPDASVRQAAPDHSAPDQSTPDLSAPDHPATDQVAVASSSATADGMAAALSSHPPAGMSAMSPVRSPHRTECPPDTAASVVQ